MPKNHGHEIENKGGTFFAALLLMDSSLEI